MKRASNGEIFRARAIRALMIACLFALQSVALAAPASLHRISHRADANAVSAASYVGEDCSSHHRHDGQGPAHHAFCVCCSLRSDDNAGKFSALIVEIANVMAAAPFVRPVYDADVSATLSQSGWTSSWSSRAPPIA
jgi:hypothetical protein